MNPDAVFAYPVERHERRHGPLGYVDSGTDRAKSLLRQYLGFPSNLPVLSQLHPPGGNSRPEGVADSHFEQSKGPERGQTGT